MRRLLLLLSAIGVAWLTGFGSVHAQNQIWAYGTAGEVFSTPAIGGDNTVYFGSRDGWVRAVDLISGQLKGEFRALGGIVSSPTLGTDGTLYVATLGGRVSAIRNLSVNSPVERWRFDVGAEIYSSPAIGQDGTVYIAAFGTSELWALNPTTGQSIKGSSGLGPIPFFSASDPVLPSYLFSSPVIGPDGTVYIGSENRKFYALRPDGSVLWTFPTRGAVYATAAIDIDGTIYIGSYDGRLYAINPDGTKKWEFQTGGGIQSSAAIGLDGTVYVGSFDGKVYAINRDGTKRAEFTTGDRIQSSPAAAQDGTVYIGSDDRLVYRLSADLQRRGSFTTGNAVHGSPVITPNGVVLIGSDDGVLYALSGSGSPLASSPWPMFKRDYPHRSQAPFRARILTPTEGRRFRAPASIPLAADALAAAGVANVQFVEGAAQIAADSVAPYTGIWDNVPGGQYSIQIRVTDGSRAEVFSRPVQIVVTDVDSAPVLRTIPDQTIDEGTLLSLSLEVVDDITPTSALRITAQVSVAPGTEDLFSGLGGSINVVPGEVPRIELRPGRDQSGTNTIIVRVADEGGLTATNRFLLIVRKVNLPPEVRLAIADPTNPRLSFPEDTVRTLREGFAISDDATPISRLVIEASSSNPQVIPRENIRFSNTGIPELKDITFTPLNNAFGTTRITIIVTDEEGESGAVSLTVTVTPVNDPPSLVLTSQQGQNVADGSTIVVPFAVFDLETPATNLTITAVATNPSLLAATNIVLSLPNSTLTNRFLTVNFPTNQITVPTPIGIIISVTDGSFPATSRTNLLTIVPANRPPVVTNQVVTVLENTPTAFTLNGFDPEFFPLIFRILTQPTVGILSNTPPNLVYFPPPNYAGSNSFTFDVSDGLLRSAVQTVTLNVLAVNDRPSISSLLPIGLPEDTASPELAFTIADSETPATGLSLSVISSAPTIVPPSNVLFGGTGTNRTVRFTPATNQSGPLVLTLVVRDGDGGTNTTDLQVNVTPVPDSPVLDPIPDLQFLDTVTTTNLTLRLSDVDSPVTALNVTVGSSNTGLLDQANLFLGSVAPNGTVSLNIRPVPGRAGSTVLTVTVSDGASAPAVRTFTVTIGAANQAPVISLIPDQTIDEDGRVSNLAFRVTDDATPPGNLTMAFESSNPTLLRNEFIFSGGSSSNRLLTLLPEPNRFGETIVSVSATDGPGRSTTNRFRLTVNPVNDLPTITDLPPLTLAENTASLDVLFFVGDVESAPSALRVAATSSNTNLFGSTNLVVSGTGIDRTLRLIPAPLQSGSATVTVTATDGDGGSTSISFLVTVISVEDPPRVVFPSIIDMVEDQPSADIPFLVSDPDSDPSLLTVTVITDPAFVPDANVFLGGTTGNRSVRFVPAPNAFGDSLIRVIVQDPTGLRVTNTSQLRIMGVNDLPTVAPIPTTTIAENSPGTRVVITISDVETAAAALAVTARSSDTNLLAHPTVSAGASANNRVLTLVPRPQQSGTATVTITVADGNGGSIDQVFLVNVTPVNDGPRSEPINDVVTPEDTVAGPIAVTVSDPDSPVSSLIFSATSSNPDLIPVSGIRIVGTGGTRALTLHPTTNASGTSQLALIFTDDDDTSTTNSFLLTVTPVNDSPQITQLPDFAMDEGTPQLRVDFGISDVESPVENLVLTVRTPNTNIVATTNLTLSGTGAFRSLTLKPTPLMNGLVSITLELLDPDGGVGLETFLVFVRAVNDPPRIGFIPDQSVPEDGSSPLIQFTLDDPESPATQLQLSVTAQDPLLLPPAGIQLGGSGTNRTLQLTPTPGLSGSTTVVIIASDPEAASTTNRFTLTVVPENDPPTISEIANQVVTRNAATGLIPFVVGDEETPATALRVTATSSDPILLPLGNIFLGGAGIDRTVQLIPATGQTGRSLVTLTVLDGGSLSATTEFELVVTFTNTPPAIIPLPDRVIDEDTLLGPLPITINDAQTPAAGLTVLVLPANPALLPPSEITYGGSGPNRTVTLTPAPNAHGTTTVQVIVTDRDGSSVTNRFAVQINPINDVPVITQVNRISIPEDTISTPIPLRVFDIETAADLLAIRVISTNTALLPVTRIEFSGTDTNRSFTVNPLTNMTGVSQITIEITDIDGAAARTTFQLEVIPVNDPPVLSAIADITLAEDVPSGPIPFTLSDAEAFLQDLRLSVRSSNPVLLPTNSIVLGGAGQERTLSFVTATNQSGSTLVTLQATDPEGATSFQEFLVRVTPVNDAPTITGHQDVSVLEGETIPDMLVAIADAETPASQLVFQARSSNTTLLPQVIVTGAGATRTLRIVPTRGVIGSSIITLSARDAELETLATFQVSVGGVAPTVTVQPTDQTVYAGDDVTFAVQAAGTLPLAYQWSRGTTRLLSATNATLALTPVASTDAGTYTVIITNAAGSVTSRVARLTVRDLPRLSGLDIATNESNAGTNLIRFALSLDAPINRPVTVQLRTQSGTALPGLDFQPVDRLLRFEPNQTNLVVEIAGLGDDTFEPDETFFIQLTSPVNAVLAADRYQVTLLNDDERPVAPGITNQPVSQVVARSTPVTFSVGATGTRPLFFQWFYNGNPLADATNTSYAIASASTNNNGRYHVTINNRAGTTNSSVATLSVLEPPRILEQLPTVVVNEGDTATLARPVAGDSPLVYQWFYRGPGGVTPQLLAGQTNSTLVFSNAQKTLQGFYSAIITNPVGRVESKETQLIVFAPIRFVQQPEPASVPSGASVTFRVTVTGDGPITYSWLKDGASIPGATNDTLVLNGVTPAAIGEYSVVVGNPAPAGPQLSTPAHLSVFDRPRILVPDLTLTEPAGDGSNAVVTVRLSNPTPELVSLRWATRNGTAIAPADYVAASGTVTFAPNTTETNFLIRIQGDLLDELDETLFVDLSSAQNGTLDRTTLQVALIDDDAPPVLRISDSVVPEPDQGTRTVTLHATLDRPSGRIAQARFTPLSGTAVSPGDFQATTGVLVFQPGETFKTLDVQIVGDRDIEPNETFSLEFTELQGLEARDARASVTIMDQDQAALIPCGIEVYRADNPALFGEEWSNRPLLFTPLGNRPILGAFGNESVNLFIEDMPSHQNLQVTLDLVLIGDWDGTNGSPNPAVWTAGLAGQAPAFRSTFSNRAGDPSAASQNYPLQVGAGTAPAGTGSIELNTLGYVFDIPGVGRTASDSIRRVQLNLPHTGGTVTLQFAATGISRPGALSWGIARAVVVAASATPPAFIRGPVGRDAVAGDSVVFSASLTSLEPVTFQWRKNGIPLAGATNDLLRFPSVALADVGTYDLVVTSCVGSTTSSAARLTVVDKPQINVTDVTAEEQPGTTTAANFLLRLTGTSPVPVSVQYTTRDGTATAPADYIARSGSVTFAPGQTETNIIVAIISNGLNEPTEQFFLDLSAPVNALPGRMTATASVLDNDPLPRIGINDVSLVEGNGGTTEAVFVLTLQPASPQAVRLDYRTANRTAVAGADFVQASGTAEFAPGTTQTAVRVQVFGDLEPEADEQFAVNLTNPSGASLQRSEAIATVRNDDAEPNRPPTIVITSPNTGASFASPAEVAITARAEDTGGSVTRVEFFAGTTFVGSDTTAPFSVTWTNSAVGTYSLSARAFDNEGLSSTSAPVTILITRSASGAAVAIIRNQPGPEIDRIQDYLIEMGLSSQVFDQDGLTLEALAGTQLVLWADGGSGGINANDVAVLRSALLGGQPLYLIGDVLSSGVVPLGDAARRNWGDAARITPITNRVAAGTITLDQTLLHPVVNGRFGTVGTIAYPRITDVLQPVGPQEDILGTLNGRPVLLAYDPSDASARVVTQGFTVTGSADATATQETRKLFRNSVIWLLRRSFQALTDLGLNVTSPAAPTPTGETVSTEWRISHRGEVESSGVALRIDLPEGMEVVATEFIQGRVTQEGRTLLYTLGSMANAETVIFGLRVRVSAPGVFTLTGDVSGDEPDPSISNNKRSLTLTFEGTVATPPRLAILSSRPGRTEATLSGASGRSYTIETSSDLRTWTPFTTVVAGPNPVTFTDTSTQPRRFYRAR